MDALNAVQGAEASNRAGCAWISVSAPAPDAWWKKAKGWLQCANARTVWMHAGRQWAGVCKEQPAVGRALAHCARAGSIRHSWFRALTGACWPIHDRTVLCSYHSHS